MKVLVDSTIWSLVLRRTRPDTAVTPVLDSLTLDGRVAIIGPIRQEVLSGIKERAHFEWLRDHLQTFPDTEIISADYEEAAAFYNECRRNGIEGSHIDFLICAVAARNGFSIFTMDTDFKRYARHLPIALYDS